MPGGWSGSNRRARLPANWGALRRDAMDRDGGRCRAVENGARCEYPATDVDHIRPSGPDDLDNLASLCTWHHRRKTAQEGNNARERNRRKPEPHPGMRAD